MAQSPFVSARHVNPEAGDHAVTADPDEQAAAEAAIRASWREFPYYAKRYGERGWRFSLSDTGWIQTLCHLSAPEARVQVRWLGGLLAARGMPLYLLERHLVHLHRELVQALTERTAQYDSLLSCANYLRESRSVADSRGYVSDLIAPFRRARAQLSEPRDEYGNDRGGGGCR